MTELTTQQQIEIEAAAFRQLVAHLRQRSDVQNIDLMNLAGFCRNCLSNWYQDAADQRELEMTREEARRYIYGMPYEMWKKRYQKETSQREYDDFERFQKEE
ncbi:DUF1244 domain-containing protein [Allorhizobium terrae]|uniref:DUF1244 domain-containing protein n=1 Tax=Allorhizobium terrae TaxID=1848972 RepID=A0A4S3ZPD4_9HYPH|nr:DUF1244 domain-containing protein [Allorhizobium terrae]THF47276.1 DUF1244 domain-containing protein [Allorhizobium terrae]TWD46755.1 hypothetical protein FB480_11361 [Agrobacterium vitis]